MPTDQKYVVAPATWYERRVVLADAIVATILTLLIGASGVLIAIENVSLPAALLPIISSAALFVRRSRPMLMVSTIASVSLVEVATVTSSFPSDIYVLVAVHTAARYCPKWFGRAALGLAIFGSAAAAYQWVYQQDFTNGPDRALSTSIIFVGLAFLVIASFALGRAQLGRHNAIQRQIAALGEQNRLMQLEHQQAMALATEHERARLAAETHDILAHSLAIIVAQADGAAMLADRDPKRASTALHTIAETSREALAEVRLKVAALRDGADPHGPDLAPTKSLRDLPELIDSVATAGPTIDVTVDGPIELVPPGPSLAAYRIVQESLTNVLKHAGPSPAVTVSVATTDTELDLQIVDNGRGLIRDGDSDGNGLRGMRTRVEQYGGTLHTGSRVGGGFEVSAHIPIPRLTEQPA